MGEERGEQPLGQEWDDLYERVAKPLEKKHWGEHIAIHPQTEEWVLAPDYDTVVKRVLERFGKNQGVIITCVGSRTVDSPLTRYLRKPRRLLDNRN